MPRDVSSCDVSADPVVLRQWHVVGRSASFESGGIYPIRILGEDLILWRSGEKLLAWQDLCIHRGVKLSLGKIQRGCELQCAYHGWTYDVSGQCTHIPAHPDLEPPSKARVKSYHAREQTGLVWVNLSADPAPMPELPEFFDDSYRMVISGPYEIQAGATRIIENFLDITHLPFVHEGYLGVPDHATISDYTVESHSDGQGLIARQIEVFQPNPDGTGIGARVIYDYGVLHPFCAFLRKMIHDDRMLLALMVTPLTETSSRAWCVIMMNYGFEISDAEIAAYQNTIIAQDIPIVESQRPERLPLDLAAELHLRSDRLAIAYRQYLKATGLTFGCE